MLTALKMHATKMILFDEFSRMDLAIINRPLSALPAIT
jgi:hypothetical protein